MTTLAPAQKTCCSQLLEGCQRLRFGEVSVDALTSEDLAGLLEGIVASREKRRISVCGTTDLLRARRDVRYRNLLLASDVVLGTGSGIRCLALLAGRRCQMPRHARDLADVCLDCAVVGGWRTFFLGSQGAGIFEFAHRAQNRHRGLKLVGAAELPAQRRDSSRAGRLLERLQDTRPDVILEAPLRGADQDFTYRHRKSLEAPVVMTLHGGLSCRLGAGFSADVSSVPQFLSLALSTLRR